MLFPKIEDYIFYNNKVYLFAIITSSPYCTHRSLNDIRLRFQNGLYDSFIKCDHPINTWV